MHNNLLVASVKFFSPSKNKQQSDTHVQHIETFAAADNDNNNVITVIFFTYSDTGAMNALFSFSNNN